MPFPRIPNIALVGRTNVGKSTLFNRLTETNSALISPVSGTTRDRKEGQCLWNGRLLSIMDTGGLDPEGTEQIELDTIKQANLAIDGADVILLVIDVKVGIMPQERELAKRLLRSKKPVIVVGNKAEKMRHLRGEDKEWRLPGLPPLIAVSAMLGTGIGDLLDLIFKNCKDIGLEPPPSFEFDATRVAVIGRPNVGKSSILNAILGEERFITSPIAHTTREPNDTLVEVGDKKYVFIDTAGIRKKGKTKKAGGLEAAGVARTSGVLRQADVALLVVDSSENLNAQERTLAGMLEDSRVGLIILANKWDLIEGKDSSTIEKFRRYVTGSIPFLTWAPILFLSAKTKQRIQNIFTLIDQVKVNRERLIPEEELEKFWRHAVRQHLPSRGKGPQAPTVLGLKQVAASPPTFDLVLKAKRTDVLHPSYLRFLENRMREAFPLEGTPIRIHIKVATAVSKRKKR